MWKPLKLQFGEFKGPSKKDSRQQITGSEVRRSTEQTFSFSSHFSRVGNVFLDAVSASHVAGALWMPWVRERLTADSGPPLSLNMGTDTASEMSEGQFGEAEQRWFTAAGWRYGFGDKKTQQVGPWLRIYFCWFWRDKDGFSWLLFHLCLFWIKNVGNNLTRQLDVVQWNKNTEFKSMSSLWIPYLLVVVLCDIYHAKFSGEYILSIFFIKG